MTNSKQNRPVVEIASVKLTTLDVFSHNSFVEITHKITETFGTAKPTNIVTPYAPFQQYDWELSKREEFFSQICKPDNFPDSNFSPDILEEYIESVKLSIPKLDWLPFYVLFLHIIVKPSFFKDKKPEEYGGYLTKISHPIRIYLATLKGMISSSNSMSPNLPLITWIGTTINEEELTSLENLYNSMRFQQPRNEQFTTISASSKNAENPFFPFNLEVWGVIQQRSAFVLASNVMLLSGFSDQLGFNGHRTFYGIVLTKDSNLVDPNPLRDLFLFAITRGSTDELYFEGPAVIASVIALNGWLQSKDQEFAILERDAITWRSNFENEINTQSVDNLHKISSLGLRASSLASDLGALKRIFSRGLERWEDSSTTSKSEIPVVGIGPLRYLATDTHQHLEGLSNNVTSLREDIDWMIRNVSIEATISSNENIMEMNRQTTKYTKWVMILTIVLIALSASLLIFTFAFH